MKYKAGDIVNNGKSTDIFMIINPDKCECIRLGDVGKGLYFDGLKIAFSGFYPTSGTKIVNILEILSEYYKPDR